MRRIRPPRRPPVETRVEGSRFSWDEDTLTPHLQIQWPAPCEGYFDFSKKPGMGHRIIESVGVNFRNPSDEVERILVELLDNPGYEIKTLRLDCITPTHLLRVLLKYILKATRPNQIDSLALSFSDSCDVWMSAKIALPAFLRSPENQVKRLSLCLCNEFTLQPIGESLKDEDCKVEELILTFVHVGEDAASRMLGELAEVAQNPKLKALSLSFIQSSPFLFPSTFLGDQVTDFQMTLFGEQICASASEMICQTLQRPGNQLRWLNISRNSFSGRELSAIMSSLQSEHCVLNDLIARGHGHRDDRIVTALSRAIRVAHTQLRRLEMRSVNSSSEALMELGLALQHPNNQIQSLTWGGMDPWEERNFVAGTFAIVEALASPNNKLRQLSIAVDARGLVEMARALRAPHCKVHTLRLLSIVRNKRLIRDVLATLRGGSSVKRVSIELADFEDDEDYQFNLQRRMSDVIFELSQKWFAVLQTLLSVKTVPRLGRRSAMREAPIADFAEMICETLDWRISVLRLQDW